jgi:hypothetical protein
MAQQEQNDIARKILEALYDAWEQHTDLSLNTVQEQGGWEKSIFRTVVDRLEKRGLVRSSGNWYSFEITPDGIFYAEDNGIVPEEQAERHRQTRTHILKYLSELYEREGSRAHESHEKIAEGAPVDRLKMLHDLMLLKDIGEVKDVSSSSFRITDAGLRHYRGNDYEDII